MIIRLFIIIAFIGFILGCATAKPLSEVTNLQIQVAQLEQNLERREQDTNQLKNEFDELSNRIEVLETDQTAASTDQKSKFKELEEAKLSGQKVKDDQNIHVAVSALEIQKALQKAGYYEGPMDGVIGQKSREAIEKFQKDNNLKTDGIVGTKTWAALKNYSN